MTTKYDIGQEVYVLPHYYSLERPDDLAITKVKIVRITIQEDIRYGVVWSDGSFDLYDEVNIYPDDSTPKAIIKENLQQRIKNLREQLEKRRQRLFPKEASSILQRSE